jgi:hypothetical protein
MAAGLEVQPRRFEDAFSCLGQPPPPDAGASVGLAWMQTYGQYVIWTFRISAYTYQGKSACSV